MRLYLATFLFAAAHATSAGAQGNMPKTWGDCLYNGSRYHGLDVPRTEDWCSGVAGLSPGGKRKAGECMHAEGGKQTPRVDAKTKCRL